MGSYTYDIHGWAVGFNLFDDYNTPNLHRYPEKWDSENNLSPNILRSLAMLGASVVFLSNHKQVAKSGEEKMFYLPNNLPAWMVEEINKYFNDEYNPIVGDRKIEHEDVINNVVDDKPKKRRRSKK